MALRADEDNPDSPLLGLSCFWQVAEKSPSFEWEQWMQLFEVAVLARQFISITELLQDPREPSLMDNFEKKLTKRKVGCLLYITFDAFK